MTMLQQERSCDAHEEKKKESEQEEHSFGGSNILSSPSLRQLKSN
jgi:hypothetical protein